MSVITGTRITKNINQDRRVVDMSKGIALLQPSKSPLIVLTKRLKKAKPTYNPIYHWLEDDLQGRWGAVDGAHADASAITVAVADGTLFAKGDIIKIPRTGEIMRVSDISTNNLTVVREYGTTTKAALVDKDPVLILGNARPEAGSAVDARTVVTSTVYNYTQIFSKSVAVSKTLDASKLYGGDDRAYQRRKAGIEHAIDIERSMWFGERAEKHSGGTTIRAMGGVLSLIKDKAQAYGASNSLTEDNFEKGFLEKLFQYGSDKKVMFCAPRVLSVINSWGRHKLDTVVGATEYGLDISKYISTHGDLLLVRHPLFEGPVYGKMGVALDLENVAYRPLVGRDTKLRTNIGAEKDDFYLDEYLTEAGFEIKLPETHGILSEVDFPVP